ncbi:hypothetical protein SAMN05892883_3721 [Jatrophihabitans sp. GAS493]|uniref:hypothetical protein n=1 Tax=Jatrophihabitans sp. GAS493 TaxID=1907575 RepID=UPI000BB78157|nr:hypothetical protein [Jatrophihabitans sp. GAS493]SOD74535.1 hypothetical protein SAMN05892883_3721 [Jatrophihabitans sp. GAS493]
MGHISGPGTVTSRLAGLRAARFAAAPLPVSRGDLVGRGSPIGLVGLIGLVGALLAAALLTGCTSRATPSPSASSYVLPAVSAADTARTAAYLRGTGAPLLGMHRSAATVALNYTDDGCRALTALISPQNQDRLARAAFAVPDAVLNELAVAEIHAIATMRACNTNTSTKQLVAVDGLLAKRFVQLGVVS